MTAFLGIDGGGTKTEFLLIDASGHVLASRRQGSAYYFEIGMSGLTQLLITTVADMLASQSLKPSDVSFAFVGLPAYGENTALLPQLDHIFGEFLHKSRYQCANDVVCGWAGALAGEDGIAVVAGTGSIAYGELSARSARSGGWGELFGDEGSAFWLAREILALFSRMSDGRSPRGPMYELVRRHFGVASDLDLCARVYGPPPLSRSELAALSQLATEAARLGDRAVERMFESAAEELAALVHAVRDELGAAPNVPVSASYCGGLLKEDGLLLPLFEKALHATARIYDLKRPRLRPAAGAAVAAARLAGTPLDPIALKRLESGQAEGRVH